MIDQNKEIQKIITNYVKNQGWGNLKYQEKRSVKPFLKNTIKPLGSNEENPEWHSLSWKIHTWQEYSWRSEKGGQKREEGREQYKDLRPGYRIWHGAGRRRIKVGGWGHRLKLSMILDGLQTENWKEQRCGQLKPCETMDKLKLELGRGVLGPELECCILGGLEGEQMLLNYLGWE